MPPVATGPTPALANGAGGFQVGDGNVNEAIMSRQGAIVAYTATATTLLAADIANGLISSTNAGAQAVTLPLAADMDTAFPNAGLNSSMDFSVQSSGNTVTMTTNTGWTLSGTMTIATTVTGMFRARKTGTAAWTLYRIA